MLLLDRNVRWAYAIAALTTSLLAMPVARAQEPAAASTELEEIVVTAQKREENLQKVSIAVDAITGDGLQRAGINDVSRLEQLVPGLVFAKSGNDAKLALRGANSNATFADNTSIVGTFVDGVYKPRASQQTRSFFDVERVELLKGPQGTLYGRNTLGGAINLYTKAPSFNGDGLTFGLTSTFARFNDFANEFFVNSAVNEKLALRLAVFTQRSDGWVKNLIGRNEGIKDTLAFRGSALWRVTDNVSALLRLAHVRENGNPAGMFAIAGACRAVTPSGLTDPLGSQIDCRNPRRGSGGTRAFDSFANPQRTIERDFINNDFLRDTNATLEVTVDFGSIALKSITSYTKYDTLLGNDADYSANPHAREWVDEREKSYTQEIQLSSTGDSPVQWTTGLYGSKDELFFAYSSLRHTLDNLAARPNVVSANGVTLPLLIGTPVTSLNNVINNTTNNTQFIDARVFGVFGQVSYAVRDNVRLVGGVRYSDEKKDAVNGNAVYVGSLTPAVAPSTPDVFPWNPATATARSNVSRKFTNTTWRAAVEVDIRNDIMGYASASTGFLSGVMNQNGTVTLPQTSKSYELGLKSRFNDDRVQLNAAIYRAEYKDLATTFQIPNPASPGSVLTLSSNGGDIEANGVEVALDTIPVEHLRLSVAAAYIDAKYGVFGLNLPQQVLNGIAPTASRFVSLNGQRPPYTPEWTGSVRASYDIKLASGTLTPQLQFRYSDAYSAAGGLPFDPAGQQPSFTQTDLRLIWLADSGKWSLEGFAENLEDEQINQRTQHGGDGIEQANYGMPINYGVRVKLNF